MTDQEPKNRCENCPEVADLRELLKKVHKITAEIHIFLNGTLNKDGWLTTVDKRMQKQDDRIIILESWRSDTIKEHKGKIDLLLKWILGISITMLSSGIMFVWGLITHKITINF